MTSFKLFAGTNVGLRENNEDNFTVCKDLTQDEWIVPDGGQVFPLGKRGCLMVVADGMGGQNAGEVASAIAIATVQEFFSPANLPADTLNSPASMKSFLKTVIAETDLRIKGHTKSHPDTDGMGSTIVLAWIIESIAYIAWLGDSRAYSFIPDKGIGRLSKDHSYVQQLVDAGKITDEGAMNHPNSNIITRSLGDITQKAKADVVEHQLVDGEILLLCTDGLCGVCADGVIGGIVEENKDDLQQCKEKLTTAALAAGGSDNITIALMKVTTDSVETRSLSFLGKYKGMSVFGNIVFLIVALFLVAGLGFAGYSLLNRGTSGEEQAKPGLSIKITLNKKAIKSGDSAMYLIEISDSTEVYLLEYDKNLLILDEKDKAFRIREGLILTNDTVTEIAVRCSSDGSVKSSVKLSLKRQTIRDMVKSLPDKIQEHLKPDIQDTDSKTTGKKEAKGDGVNPPNQENDSGTEVSSGEESESSSEGEISKSTGTVQPTKYKIKKL